MSHVTVEVAKGHPKLLHDVTKVYSAPCIESMVYLRLNVLVCQLLHCSVSVHLAFLELKLCLVGISLCSVSVE